ncbi:MAG TPA: VWA domain-containing protein [Phycisphaerae bacterium]|nr:VWA domain-containing protein [Phycisphaerae bacterium]
MKSLLAPYFENLRQWPWLMVALVVCAAAVYGITMRRRGLLAFASLNLIPILAPSMSKARAYFRVVVATLAAIAIAVALLAPRWGIYYEESHARHLDLMICLDVSRSMLARDAGMSRLERAKDDIRRLLDQMGGVSVGLICFAGKADFTCPLTDDYEYFRLVLADVDPLTAPMGGTNIGEALTAARRAFEAPSTGERAIIVITDGEDHGGTAVDESKKAQDQKIAVYTVGIGDETTGGLIPIEKDGASSYLQFNNEQVWSKANPEKLRAIAQAGGGEYHPSGQVNNRERTLEWIYSRKLAPLLREGEAQQQVERRYDRAHWFAAIALGLLVIESLMSEKVAEKKWSLSRMGRN